MFKKENDKVKYMRLKSIILPLSFLLISCAGPSSEDSKTTISDVVDYLKEVKISEMIEWRAEELGMSVEDLLNDERSNFFIENPIFEKSGMDGNICGKFLNYQPKMAKMVGAIDGGKIKMSTPICNVEVYKYSDENSANLGAKTSLLERSNCFVKGYFLFCRIPALFMHDF